MKYIQNEKHKTHKVKRILEQNTLFILAFQKIIIKELYQQKIVLKEIKEALKQI